MPANNDLAAFCIPDCSKCSPGAGDIVPNCKMAIDFLLTDLLSGCATEGTEAFYQNPSCIVWTNIPLCLGACCVPCCSLATHLRTMEAMSGKSCESNCLFLCVTGCLGCSCIYFLYHAKVRKDFRKKYNIKGSALMDCLETCCCPSCIFCQEANEAMNRDSNFAVPFCDLAAAKEAQAKLANSTAQK